MATQGLLAVILASAIFGASALFSHLDASPAWISSGRGGFAALALLIIAAITKTSLRLSLGQFRSAALMAALLGAHWVCFFASAQIGGVALCTLSVSTFPLFTIAIEAAQKRRWPSIGSMAAGFTIVLAVSLLMRSGPVQLLSAALSVGIGLAAAMLFAVFALMSQTHVHSFGTLRLAFYQYGLAALLVSPLLLLSPPFKTGADWLAIAVLGLVGTALAHQLYLYALARLPAAFCGAIVSLEPVFAIALAALIFKENATPIVWLSGAMIILASRALMRSAD